MIQTNADSPSSADSSPIRVKKLGLWGVVMVVYFAVAGGAFGIEPLIAASAPGMSIILILLTPFIYSIPTVLMVTELSTAMPVAGGYYAWVKRALGPFAGFMQGWSSWLYGVVIAASFGVLFADYTSSFLNLAFGVTVLDTNPLLHWLVVVALIVGFVLLNIRGAHAVGDSSKLFAAMVFTPFIVMIVMAAVKWGANPVNVLQPLTPPSTGILGAFGVGLFVVLYNFLGWDSVSTVLEEIKDPLKIIPKAMRLAVPLVVLAYLLPVLAGLSSGVDWKSWGESASFPELATAIGGKWLGVWVALGGMFCAAGLFNAMIMSNSRIPATLAADKYLPAFMTARHPRYGTPVVSIILCAVIYSALATSAFVALAVTTVMLYGVSLLLQFAALIALRIKEPRMRRPFKIAGGLPGVLIVSALPIVITLIAIYSTYVSDGPNFLKLAGGLLLAGPVMFLVTRAIFKRGAPDVFVPIEYDEAVV